MDVVVRSLVARDTLVARYTLVARNTRVARNTLVACSMSTGLAGLLCASFVSFHPHQKMIKKTI